MTPNRITLLRVMLAFASIALFGLGGVGSVIGLALLILVLGLDGVDGYIARRTGQTTETGAAFDIAADRMVESVYWMYFATAGLVSFWIPAIVIARGGFTDFLRMLALRQGQTPFGENGMMKTWWGRLLVGSRGSRAAYGVLKCAAFFSLGLWQTLKTTPGWQAWIGDAIGVIRFGALGLAGAAVVFCLVRGLPVLIEGARFLRQDAAPQKA
jgi:CDP-diacylglycerol--glycerol-3-phosphate 3-phosphatidyltransferase